MPLVADQRLRSLDRELDAAAYVDDFALELDATLRDLADVRQIVEQSPRCTAWRWMMPTSVC